MSPEFFRKLAQQCRDLLARARTTAARQQLQIWIDEFEAQAAIAEREMLEKEQDREPSER